MSPVAPSASDRLLTAIRAIVRAEFPAFTFAGTYEYTVSGVNGDGSINGVPTDPSITLPALNNIPLRPSTVGGTAKPTTGNKCLVRFVNQDPTRPIVVGNDALVNTVTIDASQTVNIGPSVSQAVVLAGGTAPAARLSDAVVVFFGSSPITIAGLVTGAPPGALTGTLIITAPATGVITTGNPKVEL